MIALFSLRGAGGLRIERPAAGQSRGGELAGREANSSGLIKLTELLHGRRQGEATSPGRLTSRLTASNWKVAAGCVVGGHSMASHSCVALSHPCGLARRSSGARLLARHQRQGYHHLEPGLPNHSASCPGPDGKVTIRFRRGASVGRGRQGIRQAFRWPWCFPGLPITTAAKLAARAAESRLLLPANGGHDRREVQLSRHSTAAMRRRWRRARSRAIRWARPWTLQPRQEDRRSIIAIRQGRLTGQVFVLTEDLNKTLSNPQTRCCFALSRARCGLMPTGQRIARSCEDAGSATVAR